MKRIKTAAALTACLLLAACGDNRLRHSPYLTSRTAAANDQAGQSSIPGTGANNPSGGAGGWYDPGNEQQRKPGVPTASGTGMTGGGTGHGTNPGATTAEPPKH